jgi:hypothetical protein
MRSSSALAANRFEKSRHVWQNFMRDPAGLKCMPLSNGSATRECTSYRKHICTSTITAWALGSVVHRVAITFGVGSTSHPGCVQFTILDSQ